MTMWERNTPLDRRRPGRAMPASRLMALSVALLILAGCVAERHSVTINSPTPSPTAPMPTPTWLGTLSLTASPTTMTSTPVATPTLDLTEFISNGGFETGEVWEIPITRYSAGYTTQYAHSGHRAMRLGIVARADNTYSYSPARQTITIPADATRAVLRFWLYSLSGEPAELARPNRPLARTIARARLSDDIQYLLILNEREVWIDTLLWQRSDDREWTRHEFDLCHSILPAVFLPNYPSGPQLNPETS